MIGMLKKDLFMIKNNYKSLLFALVILVFYSVAFDMDMSFFLPFMGLMMCISTFSYDDYNNWHVYASSLSQGKVNVVKSKYIITLATATILTLAGTLISCIISNTKGRLNIDESLGSMMGGLAGIIIFMSVVFPILFKYGAEKGRIAMLTIVLSIVGLVLLFTKVVKIEVPKNFIVFLDTYFVIVFVIASIVFIGISYLISKKLYLKREF